MEVDVAATPAELAAVAPGGRLAVVVDVLRATSTLVHAFAAGAAAAIPTASIERARELAGRMAADRPLLGGERKGRRVEGFDLGNSPADYTPGAVGGRTIVFCTTNGTGAIERCSGAERLLLGCLLNLSAVVREIEAAAPRRLVVVCAGHEGRLALEDFLCAGLIAGRLRARLGPAVRLRDGALAASALAESSPDPAGSIAASDHGRRLAAIGLAADVAACGRLDGLPLVPERLGGALRCGTGRGPRLSAT